MRDEEPPVATDEPPSHRPYFITPRQYLLRERAAEFKSEYNDGELVAMGGAARRHSLISTNLTRGLGNQLDGRGCDLHAHDMRVRVDEGRRYVYPDVVVACGKPVYEDGERVLVNPTVVIEVLSRSAEKKDRGWKFEGYRRLESLREIVFISQDALSVELWRRMPDGIWESHLPLRAADAILRLESVGCALSLSQVYKGLLDEEGAIEARPARAARTKVADGRAVPGSRDRGNG